MAYDYQIQQRERIVKATCIGYEITIHESGIEHFSLLIYNSTKGIGRIIRMGYYCVPVYRPTEAIKSKVMDKPRDDSGQSGAGAPSLPDPETLRQHVVIEPYKSPGPGGQRKNKRETAIRLTHIPTGIVVIAAERRSQAANRQVAFERLRKRLEQLSRPRKRRGATRPPARAVRGQHERKKRLSEKKRLRKEPSPADRLD